jgi:hypothetical protein
VPEQIGNGKRTKAWAEEIMRNSRVGNSGGSRLNLPARINLAESSAPAFNQVVNSSPVDDVLGGISQSSDTPGVQTVRDENAGAYEDPQQDRTGIDPQKIADRVYRLMQKDLLLQIERAGR